MEMLSCAITGHRPTRFKFKYNEKHTLCQKIKKSMLEVFRTLHDENGVTCYYVGGGIRGRYVGLGSSFIIAQTARL